MDFKTIFMVGFPIVQTILIAKFILVTRNVGLWLILKLDNFV